MFEGYLSLGGTEVINAARTKAYIDKNNPSIPLKNCEECDDLAEALDEGVYESPMVDDAPWFDPNDMATNRFYGLYPLSIEGIEDSTRVAPVLESIVDGGSVGAVRFGTRSIRVHGILIAGDEEAMVAGTTWLRNALDPAPCTAHGGSCGGAQLCYYSSCPTIERCFTATYEAGTTFPLSSESPSNAPYINHNSGFRTALWKARVLPTDQSLEGLIIRWGAVSENSDSELIERHGPIVYKRINYVRNPNFKAGTSFWQFSGGGSWAIVPGFGYGYGEYGGELYGGIPDSGAWLERQGGVVGVSTVKSRTDTMNAYNGQVTSSFIAWYPFDAPTPSTLTVRLRRASDDLILGSGSFPISSDRMRYSFTSVSGGECYLEFETAGTVNIDDVLVEAGFTALPYFDGSTPAGVAMAGYITGEIEDEYTVQWLGEDNVSLSQITWNGTATIGAAQDGWETSLDGICDAFPYINVAQGTLNGSLDVWYRTPINVEQQIQRFERTLHETTCVEGPTIIEERKLANGAIIREVDFLLVAGRPAPYGPTRTLLYNARMIDLDTVEWVDTDCTVPDPAPIIDPDCPPVPAPPRPPSIETLCITPEDTWQRYWLPIPSEYVSTWSATSPQVTISSGAEEIRQVRVRAYPNPFGRTIGDPDYELPVDPCSFCAEFVVSYLPANTSLTVDAILERAFANVAGGPSVPANHLLYSADGSPMIWPELTCGTDYLIAIDVPEPLLDDVTVSVTLTNKE